MKQLTLLTTFLMATLALAGCTDDDPVEQEEVLPEEINARDIQELEELAAGVPKEFSFPGQKLIEPINCLFEDTIDAGTGFMAPEFPNDDGPVDANTAYLLVPVESCTDQEDGRSIELVDGQPVEVRIKLKWWGDPGSSADMDIFVNVPGTSDAYQSDRYDESFNWNIVTKFRVVNTVYDSEAPFQIGMQIANGKNAHPDGIHYQMFIDVIYAEGVIAPYTPYAITVPEGATTLILESDPLIGDEHVDSELVIVGPDDKLVRAIKHNDIATETLIVPVSQPGEYVVYSQYQHGGFMRIETDIPNPEFEARALEKTVTPISLYTSPAPPLPGTYTEQCVEGQCASGADSFGEEGTFSIEGNFPIDLEAYVDVSEGPSTDAAVKIFSSGGLVSAAWATGSYDDGGNRIGTRTGSEHHKDRLDSDLRYGLVVNGGVVELGYVVTSYVR